ncbi:uncharacterized protein LODBEIA_P03810 [Lodderomyces beijingensis]|uniref:Uncharacterized protein n=1 Tax=Lodderomyces beijingensis TaxID=1775926 RepID=A0ABP0ZFC7_9ASCO
MSSSKKSENGKSEPKKKTSSVVSDLEPEVFIDETSGNSSVSKAVVERLKLMAEVANEKFLTSSEPNRDNLLATISIPKTTISQGYRMGSRLPRMNNDVNTRLKFLSLQVCPTFMTPKRYLKMQTDEGYIKFSESFVSDVAASVTRFVRNINDVAAVWTETKMFGNEILTFIMQESVNFIVGAPFVREALESLAMTLYAEDRIISQVKKLDGIIDKKRYKLFRKHISTTLLATYNIFIDPGECFANDVISRFITLWVYALLDIND